MINEENSKYIISHQFAHILGLNDLIDNLLYYRYQYAAFEKTIGQNREITEALATVTETAERDPSGALSYVKKRIEKYKLMEETILGGETLCLDEGFGMALAAVIFRTRKTEPKLEELIQYFPLPELIVYVKTPTKLCLSRDRNRESSRLDEFDQKRSVHDRHREACQQVIDLMSNEVEIIQVTGDGDIDQSIRNLISKIRGKC